MAKDTETQIYSTMDLYTAAYLLICGIQPILEKRGGKVIFTFPATGELYQQLMFYNSNIEVHVADFVVAVKTLRGKMLSMRDGE